MKRYKIHLIGCDDGTIFEMVLTEEQASLLEGMKRLSTAASTHRCQPTLDYWPSEPELSSE